jgi:hypothetical protein
MKRRAQGSASEASSVPSTKRSPSGKYIDEEEKAGKRKRVEINDDDNDVARRFCTALQSRRGKRTCGGRRI